MNSPTDYFVGLRIGSKLDEDKNTFPYAVLGASYNQNGALLFQVIQENGAPYVIPFSDARFSPETFKTLTTDRIV